MNAAEGVVRGTAVGSARATTDLVWISDLLWPQFEDVRATEGTEPVVGFRQQRTYVPLPSRRNPVALVPTQPREAGAAVLDSYARLRGPGRRFARRALARLAATGGLRIVSPTGLTVHEREGLTPRELSAGDVSAFLTEQLGWPVVVAIGLGTPGPNRKPVLQLLDEEGHLRAFVKVGWNATTRAQVVTEARALRTIEASGLRRCRSPRLLVETSWNGLHLAVTEPLPLGLVRHRHLDRPPPVAITAEIAASGRRGAWPLAGTEYWSDLVGRIRPVTEEGGRAGDVVRDLVRRTEQTHGERPIELGAWHGDWAPWNVGWCDGRLFVWDWEHSATQAPLGFDVLHWHYQVAFIRDRLRLGEALARAAQRSRPALTALGAPDSTRRHLLLTLYLLEMFARLEVARRAGAGTNPRFHPAVLDVMEARR